MTIFRALAATAKSNLHHAQREGGCKADKDLEQPEYELHDAPSPAGTPTKVTDEAPRARKPCVPESPVLRSLAGALVRPAESSRR